jgi:uroporphyrin-3 C-methyltransferase
MSATEVIEPAVPSRRRALPAFGLPVVVLVALLALAWGGWRGYRVVVERGEALAGLAAARANAEQRLQAATVEVAAMRREVEGFSRRLSDTEAVNKSLREETLGLGQRANLIEDALASLAERRMSGSVALRLNEAEFLLRLGQERLALFGDPAATVAAFQLADSELASIDDPALAGVRQTIAAELKALNDASASQPAAHLAALERLADAVPTLPARSTPQPAVAADAGARGWWDRALSVLGQFVRVRRLDPGGTALANPLNVVAAREALGLELLLAKAALAVGDAPRYRAALADVRMRLAETFDPQAPAVVEGLAAIDAARSAADANAVPEVGKAIAELRNLRATRALAEISARAPVDIAPVEVGPVEVGPVDAGPVEKDDR